MWKLEKTREAGLPEGTFVLKFERKQCKLFETARWCIICLSSTQSIFCIFRNGFSNFTSSIHAILTHIYMFWTVSGQIVQMMMHHLHDRVCIFCFLSILAKNSAYTQCKTPKPVSRNASSVTDGQTDRRTTDTQTSWNLRLTHRT